MNDVEEIKLGNRFVFERVYHTYHERFYFYVLKHTSSEALAEEVVQMTFIKIWEKRDSLSPAFPIEVQIARIARSIMIDALRRKAAERKALDIIKRHTELAVFNDPVEGKQLAQKVSETIESLPPECKKIFALSRFEGLTYSEIANHLSISPKTVENQVSKALKALRKIAAMCSILSSTLF